LAGVNPHRFATLSPTVRAGDDSLQVRHVTEILAELLPA
jgi:hypothetical protein